MAMKKRFGSKRSDDAAVCFVDYRIELAFALIYTYLHRFAYIFADLYRFAQISVTLVLYTGNTFALFEQRTSSGFIAIS